MFFLTALTAQRFYKQRLKNRAMDQLFFNSKSKLCLIRQYYCLTSVEYIVSIQIKSNEEKTKNCHFHKMKNERKRTFPEISPFNYEANFLIRIS